MGKKISPVDQIGLNGTKVDWSKPKWTEVDLIGPNNNCLILKEYKLYIILQVQNNYDLKLIIIIIIIIIVIITTYLIEFVIIKLCM